MTKSGWADLSDKAQWDIKVALRGPDANFPETLKWFTTSVIRGQVREVFRVGGLVNADLNLVVLPYGSLEEEDSSYPPQPFRWNYDHFFTHVQEAAFHLGVPKLQLPGQTYRRIMLINSATKAAKEMIAASEAEGAEFLPYSPKSLFSPAGIAEIKRHLVEGRIQF